MEEEKKNDLDLVAENAVKDSVSADKPADCVENSNVESDATVAKKPWYADEKPKKHVADIFTRSELLTQILAILVTSLLRALSVNMFANPNKLSLGGITGIGTILYNALGWNISLTTLIMNIPLLILAFFFINKRFALLTLLNTAITSVFLQVLEVPAFTDNAFVAALMSGILTGVAVGILLRVNCSSGGTDIIGLLIQNKFPNAKVVWIIFILNLLTGVASGIVFGSLEIAIYSFICLVSSTYAADLLQRGMLSTFEVKIITSSPKEVADYILNHLHRGATLMKSTGMYTQKEHDYVVCIIRKRQLNELKRAVKIMDPKCFMYVTSVYDTIGKGFNNNIIPTSKIK